MADLKISKDEVGIAIVLLINSGADISSATNLQMIFESPRNTLVTKTALFTTDGSDGKIQYSITSSDLSAEGVWRVRGKFVQGGETKLTTWAVFKVVE